ncbi:MAG: hypothetical protein HPY44_08190 [Armatimonadetes bacterium]|nr:hypothetical protein [Armatimonadota bacterium]
MTYYDNAFEAPRGLIERAQNDRQSLMRKETEDFFRILHEHYADRQAAHWDRDYSSEAAFLQSVDGNRRRWLEAVGDYGECVEDMNPLVEPWLEDDSMIGYWVTIDLYPGLRGRGTLVLPKNAEGPVPLVICQHGIGSSPERVFGFLDDAMLYHEYGRRVVEAGFAVLAPCNITEGPPRARQTRLASLLGKTLWGLEIAKIRRLLDYAATREEVDAERVGMWGISLGGAYTLFTMPLEMRIKAGVCCAWFNHRVRKMVFDDPRYSCFLSVQEEHIWIPGWLREFTDSDLVSLICPRAFMSQTGKADGIAWWPFVQEEFAHARNHYARLGIAERIELDLHEGGHEIRVETGLRFLRRWLVEHRW